VVGPNTPSGRTVPNNLNEQLAMQQVKSNPLNGATPISITMNDPRWHSSLGWIKMQTMLLPLRELFVFISYIIRGLDYSMISNSNSEVADGQH